MLARDHDFRDLLATGKYVEVTGLDELEADTALEGLAESNPDQLNVFFRSIGLALPADGPRRSVHGGAAQLVQSLNWAHFGILREVTPGEHAKHGAAAASAPVKALLATLQRERGGELAFKGGLYRVVAHGDTTHLRRGGGYEVVPSGEAVPLLQAMAADARGATAVKNALEDAARFIDGSSSRGGVLLLRKSADRAGGPGTDTTAPPKPAKPKPTSGGKTSTDEEPTIRLVNIEAPTFVPGAETTTISYAIDGPVPKTATVTMIVESVPAHGDSAVVENLDIPGPFSASGSIDWDGKAETPGGFITLKGSPYEVTFALVSKSGKKSKSAVGKIQLEVKEVKISVDDTGPLDVADPWKSSVDALITELTSSGMPGDCKGRIVVDSPLFKITNGEMNDDSSFATYQTLAGPGPTIPLLAQIKLKSKTGDGKQWPAALIGTRLLWDFKLESSGDLDGSLSGRGMHDAGKTFVKKASSFEESATQPKGTSSHFKVGGYRAKSADRISPSVQWLAGGDWAMTPPAQRDWAAFTGCGDSADGRADSAIYFSPGRMAGDTHSVRAVVDVDESLDVTDEAAPDGAPAPRKSNTIKLTAWRRIPIVANWKVGASTTPISTPPLTAEYKKAGLIVEPAAGVVPTDIGAQWTTEYQTVAAAYKSAGTAFFSKALATDPQGYPVAYLDFMDYWKAEHADAGFFGTLWERIRNFFSASDRNEYKQKCEDNWNTVMNAVSQRIPIPDNGITALKFAHEHPHNQNPNEGSSITAGIAPVIAGVTTRTRTIFFQFTVGDDTKTFIHEVGHTLFLAHAPGHFQAGKQPGGYQPSAHDKDQVCLMSYASNKKYLCGLCFVKLGGWNYTLVKNDGTIGP